MHNKALNLQKVTSKYTYFIIDFAIFGCILFQQIVFKTSKSCIMSWFLYHRLDLRWFQGCPIITFLSERLKRPVFYWISTCVFASQNCIKSTIFIVVIIVPKRDYFWSKWAKLGQILVKYIPIPRGQIAKIHLLFNILQYSCPPPHYCVYGYY